MLVSAMFPTLSYGTVPGETSGVLPPSCFPFPSIPLGILRVCLGAGVIKLVCTPTPGGQWYLPLSLLLTWTSPLITFSATPVEASLSVHYIG